MGIFVKLPMSMPNFQASESSLSTVQTNAMMTPFWPDINTTTSSSYIYTIIFICSLLLTTYRSHKQDKVEYHLILLELWLSITDYYETLEISITINFLLQTLAMHSILFIRICLQWIPHAVSTRMVPQKLCIGTPRGLGTARSGCALLEP